MRSLANGVGAEMAKFLCIDLDAVGDAADRVPRTRQSPVQKRQRPSAKASQAGPGSSFRGRENGVVRDLGVLNDGVAVHTTSTLALNLNRRKHGIRKHVPRPIRLIDYGPRESRAKVTVNASIIARRRALTATEREAIERATVDSFCVRVDTGARGAAIPLRAADFKQVLCAFGKLSDAHVNAYCELINKRNVRYFRIGGGERLRQRVAPAADDSQVLVQGGRQRMFIFSSFLHTLLVAPRYKHEQVRRWTEKRSIRVLDYGRLILPVNIDNIHWVLAAVDVQHKRFVYLDSMRGSSRDVLQRVRQWFVDEVTDKYGDDEVRRLGIATWDTIDNPPYVPLQKDGESCGIFAVILADYLEHGQVPDFSQADIPVLRQRTALALMRGALPEYQK